MLIEKVLRMDSLSFFDFAKSPDLNSVNVFNMLLLVLSHLKV